MQLVFSIMYSKFKPSQRSGQLLINFLVYCSCTTKDLHHHSIPNPCKNEFQNFIMCNVHCSNLMISGAIAQQKKHHIYFFHKRKCPLKRTIFRPEVLLCHIIIYTFVCITLLQNFQKSISEGLCVTVSLSGSAFSSMRQSYP